MGEILYIGIAFLCGSIPTGYLLTKKMCGIDIRTKGSGNTGATNVGRVAGAKGYFLTLLVDMLKGLLPVLAAIYIFKGKELFVEYKTYLSIVALATILGHDYTPFLKFKGGKGVITTIGSFLPIVPVAVLVGTLVYFGGRFFTKIVSIRSVGIGMAIPLVSTLINVPIGVNILAAVAGALMVVRHRDNMKRFVRGEEKQGEFL